MREQAKILLEFMRKAGAQHVYLNADVIGILREVLDISEREGMEIGEVLKADIRERIVNSPHFAEINNALNSFPKIDE